MTPLRATMAAVLVSLLLSPGSSATTVDVAMVGVATLPWFCGGNMTLEVYGQDAGPWWTFSLAGASAPDCPLDPTVAARAAYLGFGTPGEGFHAAFPLWSDDSLHIGPLAFDDPPGGRFVASFAWCPGVCLEATLEGVLASCTAPSSFLPPEPWASSRCASLP